MKKQFQRARRGGMTNLDILKVRELARRETQKMETQAVEKAFLYMLAIPLDILAELYWPKSSKRKMKQFISEVMSLFKSVELGIVDVEELHQSLQKYADIDIREEWYKNKSEDEKMEKKIYEI